MMRLRAERSTLGVRAAGLVLGLVMASGCSSDLGPHRFTRFAMGTVVDYTVVGVGHDRARAAVDSAHQEIERVSNLLWQETETSEVHGLNHACAGEDIGQVCPRVVVSDETGRFLERALAYRTETEGAFDVTVGSFLPFYGFEVDPPVVPDSAAILERISQLGPRHLEVDATRSDSLMVAGMRSGVRVSVGGIAKGYAVDRAVSVLRQSGIQSALINAGGDLFCLGANRGKPWRVGIQDPNDPGNVIASLEVTDAAVATSGDYQRYFEVNGIRYHHLLDPETGFPARRARSATIVTTTSAERADALATGLFVAGRKGLDLIGRLPAAEGLVVGADGLQYETDGFAKYETKR